MTCSECERHGCHGECQNYIIEMLDRGADHESFERLFKEIPKFNYVLTEKVNAIFGTDLEVATDSKVAEKQTKEFNDFLYATNENGNTNLFELKKAQAEKEIFGESYLFYDRKNFYFIKKSDLSVFQKNDKDPIIDKVAYYTIGNVEVPEKIVFPKSGFIQQDEGYIISPNNIVKLKSDSYAMNSDLKQLQILLEINRKIHESTTKRDYGDIFLFTTEPHQNVISAVAERIKNTANETIKKMRERVAKLLKRNKVEDSNVVVLDETYKSVTQIKPITSVKDYQFIWESQDDIVTSVFNFPMLLAGLGDEAGNVSKEALLKEARANALTPLKSDTANALSKVAKLMFGKEYYLRFQDYSEVSADYAEENQKSSPTT